MSHEREMQALAQALGLTMAEAQTLSLAIDAHTRQGTLIAGTQTLVTTEGLGETLLSGVDSTVAAGLPDTIGGESDRYQLGEVLGEGGMGIVYRALDRRLGRTLALKVLHAHLEQSPEVSARFVEEAQASSQLQHPGIVPIHDFGRLPDGRLFFTMREIRGRTLAEVIAAVHAASPPADWGSEPGGWTVRKLIEAIRRVAEAVGYAHRRGVLHRDLKPDNVMVGNDGEVLVLDWGVLKVVGWEIDSVSTNRSAQGSHLTRAGQIAGTPEYMSPEQAAGEPDEIDPRTDVYSLGAMLYEVLTGKPPYESGHALGVLVKVITQPPIAIRERTDKPVQDALVAVVEQAMARARSDRFSDASELAATLGAWLDGERARETARGLVLEAAELDAQARSHFEAARSVRRQAEEALSLVAPHEPEEAKSQGWELQDKSIRMEAAARRAALESEQLLHTALSHAPDCQEAHASLAARYATAHRQATLDGDVEALERSEMRLHTHAEQMAVGDPMRTYHLRYLAGRGALTLLTEPSGAEVILWRYETHHRRLVKSAPQRLGVSPLRSVELPVGSYLVEIHHPTCASVAYPVRIGRLEHWNAIPPGQHEPAAVVLPPLEALADDDCYVPGGWFHVGGDREAPSSMPRRALWCESFVMKRHPVTNREYLAFLNDLVRTGQEEEALRHTPRERGSGDADQKLLYRRRPDGEFELGVDDEGDTWLLGYPIFMIPMYSAFAYASWRADREGLPWRIPSELEWEKAARGVDGRFFPWGDHFDPSWCCMSRSKADRWMPHDVGDGFDVDESPYGVRGLAGNASDVCAELFSEAGPPTLQSCVATPPPLVLDGDAYLVYRGGSWNVNETQCRLARRRRVNALHRDWYIGIRLVRSF